LDLFLNAMKQVILSVPDKKYEFFIELIKNLEFVKGVEEVSKEPGKKEIIAGIRQAVEEVKLIKAGKLKGRPAQELLDEL
jgi:hypothetical protein